MDADYKSPSSYSRNTTDSAELMANELSLEIADIMPLRIKQYDKNRAPKLMGQPTVVYFHVTVLSLDSINEVRKMNTTTRDIPADYFYAFAGIHDICD